MVRRKLVAPVTATTSGDLTKSGRLAYINAVRLSSKLTLQAPQGPGVHLPSLHDQSAVDTLAGRGSAEQAICTE
jgi:hypothetical protein